MFFTMTALNGIVTRADQELLLNEEELGQVETVEDHNALLDAEIVSEAEAVPVAARERPKWMDQTQAEIDADIAEGLKLRDHLLLMTDKRIEKEKVQMEKKIQKLILAGKTEEADVLRTKRDNWEKEVEDNIEATRISKAEKKAQDKKEKRERTSKIMADKRAKEANESESQIRMKKEAKKMVKKQQDLIDAIEDPV